MTILDKLKNIGKICLATAALYLGGCKDNLNVELTARSEFQEKYALFQSSNFFIKIETPKNCAEQLVQYAQKTQKNIENGISILEKEIERGSISRRNAQDAYADLIKGFEEYRKYAFIERYINEEFPHFQYVVNFEDDGISEIIKDNSNGGSYLYPAKELAGFRDFLRKYDIRDGSQLLKVTEELWSIHESGKEESEISPHRNIPFVGKREILDEFVHPDKEADMNEAAIVTLSTVGLLGVGFYLLMRKRHKKRLAEAFEKEMNKPVQIPNAPKAVTNPWNVNIKKKDEDTE